MKRIEDIVASLEVSRRLKKAGYKQDTIWIHHGRFKCDSSAYCNYISKRKDVVKSDYTYWYPAPTATELLEKLPAYYKIGGSVGRTFELRIEKIELIKPKRELYRASYVNINYLGKDRCGEENKKLEDALGELYLSEQNLLSGGK